MKAIVCGILSLLIGVGGIYAAWDNLRTRAELRQWPAVQGRVLERGQTGGNRRYEARVRYAYEVAGKEFSGDLVYPQRMGPLQFRTAAAAQERADAFAGDAVEVHYNPADPAEAYLALRSASQLRWVGAASAVPLLAGILLLAYAAARARGVRGPG